MKFLQKFIREERGALSALVAVGIFVIMGFIALGVDVGYKAEKRSSLQKAADISALAGARSILSYGDDLDLIKNKAVTYGHANLEDSDTPAAAFTTSDVSFYRESMPVVSEPDQIAVLISRTQARNNPLPAIFGPLLGVNTFDVTASASAGIYSMCSTKCMKPFTIPDKFTYTDTDGDNELTIDNAEEMASVVVQGYSETDFGVQLLLKPGSPGDTVVPGQFNAIDFPPVNKGGAITGGAAYRENIAGCTGSNSTVAVGLNDELQLEPGNMTGPTKQGIDSLINSDPGAYWDAATQSIKGSSFTDPLDSPRVALIPFYDPTRPMNSGRNTVFVHFIGAVFIESMTNRGDVTARFIKAHAVDPDSGTEGECLVYTTRLAKTPPQ